MADPTPTLDQRYLAVNERRTKLAAQIERIKGKKEAAESNLKAAEEACRARKVEPDSIDSYIEKLEARYEQLLVDVENKVEQLEQQIAPFLGDEDEDRSSQE